MRLLLLPPLLQPSTTTPNISLLTALFSFLKGNYKPSNLRASIKIAKLSLVACPEKVGVNGSAGSSCCMLKRTNATSASNISIVTSLPTLVLGISCWASQIFKLGAIFRMGVLIPAILYHHRHLYLRFFDINEDITLQLVFENPHIYTDIHMLYMPVGFLKEILET